MELFIPFQSNGGRDAAVHRPDPRRRTDRLAAPPGRDTVGARAARRGKDGAYGELPGVTGHYSAYTNPDELARDIRRFFRPLRTATSKEN
jgi:hypothetical protein